VSLVDSTPVLGREESETTSVKSKTGKKESNKVLKERVNKLIDDEFATLKT
jgi:hypothetical protein